MLTPRAGPVARSAKAHPFEIMPGLVEPKPHETPNCRTSIAASFRRRQQQPAAPNAPGCGRNDCRVAGRKRLFIVNKRFLEPLGVSGASGVAKARARNQRDGVKNTLREHFGQNQSDSSFTL